MDGRLHIKLQIAGRYYPLIIDRSEEEKLRSAARQINDKVAQYQQRYADKDGQDLLAMAGLQFVLRMMELEQVAGDKPVTNALGEIIEELDLLLKHT